MTIDTKSLEQMRAVQNACLEAAREGYERAAIAGLCHEGAVELSLDAIRSLDVAAVLAGLQQDQPERE